MVAQRVLLSDYSAHPLLSLSLSPFAGRLPPQLLASTRASYVRPVYTTSALALIIHPMPFAPDTLVSDTAIFVLIGRLGWRTLPHLAGNHSDRLFEGGTWLKATVAQSKAGKVLNVERYFRNRQ